MAQSGEPNKAGHFSALKDSVSIPRGAGLVRRIFAISGPAYLVSVGYMDPGNWATDIAAGSSFNYALLWILLMSNVIAMLLQSLAVRLGVVRGLDLAQTCRAEYSRPVNAALYALCEVAITACDLAEVLGSAIALQLLFHLPLIWGVLLTAADTLGLLFLSQLGIRKLEAVVISLISMIAAAFFIEIFLARPDWGGVAAGLIPSLPGNGALFVAIGMIGATVMPHNLYLHSALVQTRAIGGDEAGKRQALKLNNLDSAFALNVAMLVNAAILIMAAAVFHRSGHTQVAEIQDAHRLLAPLLGTTLAPFVFALALLASGQSSTLTGTLAGQVVMEGFLGLRLPAWVRRLVTRLAAIVPAVIVLSVFGERSTGSLLILSQVVLSLQLPFAIVPLVSFVSDGTKMKSFAIGGFLKASAWLATIAVAGMNVWLVKETAGQWFAGAGPSNKALAAAASCTAFALAVFLVYLAALPFFRGMKAKGTVPGVHAPKDEVKWSLEEALKVLPYNRVAIALDFSGRDSEVIRETLRLVGGGRPAIGLMHVVESASAKFSGEDSLDAETLEDRERLEDYAASLRGMGFEEVGVLVGSGKPVPELQRLVGEFEPDVVVMGAHGHRFFKDLLFGSTADALRHRIKANVFVVGRAKESE